jgi:hypothetical protein
MALFGDLVSKSIGLEACEAGEDCLSLYSGALFGDRFERFEGAELWTQLAQGVNCLNSNPEIRVAEEVNCSL